MTIVVIRDAVDADHGAIRSVLAEGYAGFGDDSPYLQQVLDPSSWVRDATATLVATLGDDVVGVVAFALAGSPLFEDVSPPSGDASFRFLAVAERARGRGIGARLVGGCLDRARAAGARRVTIFTMPFMTAARRLYPRFGFVRRPDLDVEFPGGPGLALTCDLTDDASVVFGGPGPVPEQRPWYADVFVRPETTGA